jgi:hypothetical protein
MILMATWGACFIAGGSLPIQLSYLFTGIVDTMCFCRVSALVNRVKNNLYWFTFFYSVERYS